MATLNQYPPHVGPQSPPVAEYAFPSVLQFLQTEWRRFERDRNEWDIEKAEMKARIAFLEGEKRGVDSSKVDLMKRVKMLEYALRQERSKYVEGNNSNNNNSNNTALTAATTTTTTANLTLAGKVNTPSLPSGVTNANGYHNLSKAQKRMSTSSTGQNMTQVSPTTSTSLDLLGRAKSREFLRVCLQEISYLTSSVPQSITASMPPAPSRLARQESEKRAAGPRAGLSRNRNSDYYPSPPPLVGPPPMPRSNSVPVPTLQSLGIKPIAGSPPLDMPITETTGAIHDESEDATLRFPPVMPQQRGPAPTKHQRHGSVDLDIQKASKVVPKIVSLEITVPEETPEEQEKNNKANGDEDEEPITVIHSPISEEHWHAQLQKAGQKLKAKRPVVKEDEAQLSKDVQDKFNISTEKLNRMVKEWDRSKSGGDNGFGTKSMRKKKGRENSAMLDELAALSLSEFEAEEAGTGAKMDSGSLEDSAPRWRHKASLKRHLDTVSSLAFHPVNKSILTGSEDGTMRYWNLEPLLRETRKNVSAEIEPVHIYRGHTKSITSVAISVDQNKCFSSSLDSTVRSWKLVPMDKETYSRA
ncbi:hypothetical protein BG005_003131, partial [Podila minutissima]